VPPTAADGASVPGGAVPATDPAAPAAAPRLRIETPRLEGSISLVGGRIDDLQLKDYLVSLDEDSPIVTLLRPAGTEEAYYALHGWAPAGGLGYEAVPGPNTDWTVESGETLTPASPVTLAWDNGAGLVFRKRIAIDDDFMFTVTQSVENTTDAPVRMAPYGIIARQGTPSDLRGFFILHEGVIGVTDGTLTEVSYRDIAGLAPNPDEGGAAAERIDVGQNGWIGFTDHFWMATLVPPPGQTFTAVAKHTAGSDTFQTDARLPVIEVAPGAAAEVETWLFAGAKEWATIRDYQDNRGIDRFVDAIDWGWFFFLTKPIFWVLHHLNVLIGNMGFAIIGLTLAIKLLLFPLAYKSYVSMSKMKALQPEMEKIKERAGDDRMKLQQEVMALYKNEKVNPAAGCLPILLQIPIFFSLYKVIFVTIELRHAPFVGWIRRPLRARPDLDPQPLRPAAMGHARPDEPLLHLLDRHLADPARRLDVAADEAQPDADRQDPGDDLRLDALDLHVHARHLRERPGDLLGGEQRHHLHPAIQHHAQPGREPQRDGQHPVDLPAAAEGRLRWRGSPISGATRSRGTASRRWRPPCSRPAAPCPGTGSGRSPTRPPASSRTRRAGRPAPTSAAARSRRP
jgi:YidC/Oxa1 family membrane protein insertase